MSLSCRRRDRDGNVHHYFVPFNPLIIVVLVGIFIGLAWSAWCVFCAFVYGSPTAVALTIAVGLGVGFGSVAVARLSVIRRGSIFSFGSKQMSNTMRRFYVFGYAAMGCACLLAALFAMAA